MKVLNKNHLVQCSLMMTLAAGFAVQSCTKFVQIAPAPNLIVSTQVFSDSVDANSAVLGLYIPMAGNSLNISPYFGYETIYGGLYADELISASAADDNGIFYANALVPNSGILNNFWIRYYHTIYNATAIIEHLEDNKSISTSARNQFIGEAKVVRALSYFHLVNQFGAVPLVTTSSYEVNAGLTRASIDSIYQQMISDLTDAENLLPKSYLTNGRVRPNYYTAVGLLARVYLFRQQWSMAQTEASKILSQTGIYGLVALSDVFLSANVAISNIEAIWQLIPAYPGGETAEGQVFVPANSQQIPRYSINSPLLNSFEPGDLRITNWLGADTINGKTYYYPYKYKLRQDGNSAPLENYMVLRVGEQYLIRAEAETYGVGDGLNGAIADLNQIRHRAGLPDYAGATDAASLRAAIYHEREVELFCEWGMRWYDLKRIGKVDSVMGAPGNVSHLKGGSWSSYKALYPIPKIEINLSALLTQNPGYPN